MKLINYFEFVDIEKFIFMVEYLELVLGIQKIKRVKYEVVINFWEKKWLKENIIII